MDGKSCKVMADDKLELESESVPVVVAETIGKLGEVGGESGATATENVETLVGGKVGSEDSEILPAAEKEPESEKDKTACVVSGAEFGKHQSVAGWIRMLPTTGYTNELPLKWSACSEGDCMDDDSEDHFIRQIQIDTLVEQIDAEFIRNEYVTHYHALLELQSGDRNVRNDQGRGGDVNTHTRRGRHALAHKIAHAHVNAKFSYTFETQ